VRYLVAALLTLAATTAAAAQPSRKDFSSLIETRVDADTGARVATSIGAAEVKEKRS
jgi:hypothetical protein